jgi:hypothetical protein
MPLPDLSLTQLVSLAISVGDMYRAEESCRTVAVLRRAENALCVSCNPASCELSTPVTKISQQICLLLLQADSSLRFPQTYRFFAEVQRNADSVNDPCRFAAWESGIGLQA